MTEKGIERTVLFLCVFNATRSIMAEALLNHLGRGRFRASSAGEFPSGQVHPLTLECLAAHAIPTEGLHSKTWERSIGLGAPRIDFIITVCSDSKEDMSRRCGQPPLPIKAHWDTANPIGVGDPDEIARRKFEDTFERLKRRVEALLQLPLDTLDRETQWREIMRIGESH
jgi:arsenate reductase (thioredoxin)